MSAFAGITHVDIEGRPGEVRQRFNGRCGQPGLLAELTERGADQTRIRRLNVPAREQVAVQHPMVDVKYPPVASEDHGSAGDVACEGHAAGRVGLSGEAVPERLEEGPLVGVAGEISVYGGLNGTAGEGHGSP